MDLIGKKKFNLQGVDVQILNGVLMFLNLMISSSYLFKCFFFSFSKIKCFLCVYVCEDGWVNKNIDSVIINFKLEIGKKCNMHFVIRNKWLSRK